jgi:hypothetical protein
MDPKGLGRERHLAHDLDAAGLGSQGRRRLEKLIAISRGNGQLEARKQDADDHRHSEHMFAGAEDRPRRLAVR